MNTLTKRDYLAELDRRIAIAVKQYKDADAALNAVTVTEGMTIGRAMEIQYHALLTKAESMRTLHNVERVLDLKPWDIVSTQ